MWQCLLINASYKNKKTDFIFLLVQALTLFLFCVMKYVEKYQVSKKELFFCLYFKNMLYPIKKPRWFNVKQLVASLLPLEGREWMYARLTHFPFSHVYQSGSQVLIRGWASLSTPNNVSKTTFPGLCSDSDSRWIPVLSSRLSTLSTTAQHSMLKACKTSIRFWRRPLVGSWLFICSAPR